MSLQRRSFLQSMILSAGSLSLLETYHRINEQIIGNTARNEYSITRGIHYLNHASIGTCPIEIQNIFKAYIEKCEENPARYIWGEEWDLARTEVRQGLADFLGCSSEELAITHNTTEGFNQIAQGLDLTPDDEVVFSNLNHSGASICFHHYSKLKGYQVRIIEAPLDEAIHWSAEEITAFYVNAIGPKTKLLVFPHIDNMIGYRHPVKMIAAAARAKGVDYIGIDAAQSIGMIPIDLEELNVDFYCGSPHKWLQSPKGLGIFYVRREIQEKCQPMWVTWGQNRWKDTAQIYEDYGTRDLPTVLSLGHAIQFHQKMNWTERTKKYQALRQTALDACRENVTWYSPKDYDNGSSLFSVKVTGADKKMEKKLAQQGYIVRGFNQGFIRISPNTMNDQEEIKSLMDQLSVMG